MTEQQYRVIADRDKGDDPKYADAQPGDRITLIRGYTSTYESADPVRIERPVPTTDEPRKDGPLMRGLAQSKLGETVDLGSFAQYAEHPSAPTREQIAEAVALRMIGVRATDADVLHAADAVFALLNGADHG